MKIGIFGGTFDPPHIGHQILAAEALEQLCLDCVYWVLTPYPPHKQSGLVTSVSHRLKMVELAIDDNPNFILSNVDIERDPPHYALDTILILKAILPGDELFYLMGLDSLNDLPAWHHPIDFIAVCDHIGVMVREGQELNLAQLEIRIPGISKKVLFLKTPLIGISASDIRARAISGRQFRYLVPNSVYQYIQKNHLYVI